MTTSSTPSDYQFLLRTLSQGNFLAKSQCLKRFNALIISDKKQFSNYAKRVVLCLGDLLIQPKQDINLLSSTLTLQIINLNPRDIEFYVKSKLLRSMVINLGDSKPQIRKTSHYCLLAYIRTYKNFDDLIEAYINYGILSNEWQLRQKAINSFQSILVMQMRHVNWSSNQFKKIFQILLVKLKDQNGFVQKASEQCLLSLSKVEQLRSFSKKLSPMSFGILKGFCQQQFELGNLNEIKMDLAQKKAQNESIIYHPHTPIKLLQNNVGVLTVDDHKTKHQFNKNINSSNQIQVIQPISYRKKNQQNVIQRRSLRKVESMNTTPQLKDVQVSQVLQLKNIKNPQISIIKKQNVYLPPIGSTIILTKQQKIQNVFGKKILQDLKNDKDWKTRLQAIQQLQNKFNLNNQDLDYEAIMKNLLPILIKLLADANFKVALTALKIIQSILRTPQISLDQIVPQIVQKLSDNKVALRQNVSKLIKNQYSLTKQPIWIDNLMNHLKKSSNANIREQILTILFKLYQDGNINYSFQKILQLICPLMDDLKTKIKIKTLDLLALITIKSQKIDRCKNLLATKINQVYYQMYLEKIGKQMKIIKQQQYNQKQKQKIIPASTINMRKITKLGTTTSTSLPKYKQANSTVKTSFYDSKGNQTDTMSQKSDIQNQCPKISDISHLDSIQIIAGDGENTKKKSQAKHLKRRMNKSIQSRILSTNNTSDDIFPPFSQPQKQLKNILIEIKSDDWQVSNQALIKLRRIIVNHSQLLVSSVVKNLIPDIMKLSESLRSTLSKNAVIVINQLSNKVKRMLDSDLDLIFSKLIKKTLDTNSFIYQQVKRTLSTICSNCNETKVINLLNTTHISRAIPIKTAIVNILQSITFIPKVYDKQLQRIVPILVDFLSQGSLQIRQKTKVLLNNIILSDKGESILKYIPIQHRNKLKKRQPVSIMKIIQPQILQQKINIPPIQVKQPQQLYQRRKKKSKIINFPVEFQQIQSILEHCQSSQWKIRLQNMNQIADICRKYPQQIAQHRSSNKIVDLLSKQINDPNNKVAINALKIFEDLVVKMPFLIQASLSVVLNQIFICFSSSKMQIKVLAQELFDIICGVVQKWMLTQHLCNGILYSVQKSKPIIISKLNMLIPAIYKLKPNIFQKNVYQMINKIAEQSKTQLMNPLKELLNTIYTQVGEDCMTFLKQKSKQLIFQ